MRRFPRNSGSPPLAEVSDAKDLVDLAARMGIPPEDAVLYAAQLISDANHADSDAVGIRVAPRS
jgi:hypothetical protein